MSSPGYFKKGYDPRRKLDLRPSPNKRHGHRTEPTPSPTYYSWTAMKRRCRDPKKIHYFGRITVCERWQRFDNFLEDMGIRPDGTQLDRINNEGNYEPGNCRWATASQQAINRRNPWITRRLNMKQVTNE